MKNDTETMGIGSGDLFGVWIATADNPHPDKPGKKSYEIVPCLVVHKGEIEICAWNCEHGVWDDAEGDDFRYQTAQVSHWMPLPSLPSPNDSDQPRGPSEDGVSDAGESSENGRLPALRCGGWFG